MLDCIRHRRAEPFARPSDCNNYRLTKCCAVRVRVGRRFFSDFSPHINEIDECIMAISQWLLAASRPGLKIKRLNDLAQSFRYHLQCCARRLHWFSAHELKAVFEGMFLDEIC